MTLSTLADRLAVTAMGCTLLAIAPFSDVALESLAALCARAAGW